MESGLGIISWIIFRALAGWVASMIAGTNREQGWLENIIVGIIGAFWVGLFGLLTGRDLLRVEHRQLRRGRHRGAGAALHPAPGPPRLSAWCQTHHSGRMPTERR